MNRWRDLQLKVNAGAIIPWRCILLGHIWRRYTDGWLRCDRQGCSRGTQWTKDYVDAS